MRIAAVDVLDVEQIKKGRAGVWFLNWSIAPKLMKNRTVPDARLYAGCGLYAVCFEGEVIYIGSYLGNSRAGANFQGDVVRARWWTHIGAITVRGDKVHVARGSLNRLRRHLGAKHPMVAGFNNANPSIYSDAGNLSPFRRLLFASDMQKGFLSKGSSCLSILTRFSFVYVRYSQLPKGMTLLDLRHHILGVEKNLIKKYNPSCNTTHAIAAQKPEMIASEKVSELFAEELGLES